MTIQVTDNNKMFQGSGNTGPFMWTFRFFSNSDIDVYKIADGVTTLLVESTDYVLTGAGSYDGGSITLTTAMLNGEELFVNRSMPFLQNTDIRNQGDFFPETYEEALDKIVILTQQLRSIGNQAIRVHETDVGDYFLPAEDKAGKIVSFDSEGNPAYISASYSITATTGGSVSSKVYADASQGDVTVELVSGSDTTVIRTDDTSHIVTVVPPSGGTFSEDTDYILYLQNESITFTNIGDVYYEL